MSAEVLDRRRLQEQEEEVPVRRRMRDVVHKTRFWPYSPFPQAKTKTNKNQLISDGDRNQKGHKLDEMLVCSVEVGFVRCGFTLVRRTIGLDLDQLFL